MLCRGGGTINIWHVDPKRKRILLVQQSCVIDEAYLNLFACSFMGWLALGFIYTCMKVGTTCD